MRPQGRRELGGWPCGVSLFGDEPIGQPLPPSWAYAGGFPLSYRKGELVVLPAFSTLTSHDQSTIRTHQGTSLHYQIPRDFV